MTRSEIQKEIDKSEVQETLTLWLMPILILIPYVMHECNSNWSLFADIMSGVGSIGAAVFTIFIYRLASKEWKRNNSISELDLYYKIKRDFSTEFSQDVLINIARNDLEFKSITEDYSTIEWLGGPVYDSSYFVQAFLGSFEDLAMFHDKGLMAFETLNSGYGSTILMVGNNRAIVDLIRHLRARLKDGDANYYSGFEDLYRRVRETLEEDRQKYYRKDFSSEPENS